MKKILAASIIGNALEWYDFILYAQFTNIISEKFFPESEYSMIFTFAVFAVGFIVRPLGGVFFGSLGDRFGRRVSLTAGILLMVVPTTGIGLLPGYEILGLAAPTILVLLRMSQGFSLGGEFSGCVAYLVETAPPHRRGLFGAIVYMSQCLGMLMGLSVAALLEYLLSEADLSSWGWRVPFLVGFIVGIISLLLRRNLAESSFYMEIKSKGYLSKMPLKEVFKEHRSKVLLAVALYVNATAPFYAATIFIPNYLGIIGYEKYACSLVSAITLLVMIGFYPVAAYISDRWGRKPVIVGASLLSVFLLYPIFHGMQSANFGLVLFSQVVFSLIVALYMAPIPTILAELFPTQVRFTGIALSCNVSAAIFGGTMPMIGTMLYQFTGDNLSIVYYLILIAALGFFVSLKYKETYKKDLALR